MTVCVLLGARSKHVWPSACLTQGGRPVPAAGTRGSPSFMSSLGGVEWARSQGPTCSHQAGSSYGTDHACHGDGLMAAGPTFARRRADERPCCTGTCTCDTPGPNWTGPLFSAFAMHAHHSTGRATSFVAWTLKECRRFDCEVAVRSSLYACIGTAHLVHDCELRRVGWKAQEILGCPGRHVAYFLGFLLCPPAYLREKCMQPKYSDQAPW